MEVFAKRAVAPLPVLVAVALLAGACSKSPSSTAGPPPSAPPATAGAPVSGSSSNLVKAPDPETAARLLYAAWTKGDRTAGLDVASPAAVDTLFVHPFGGPDETFQGCEPSGNGFLCAYSYEGGATAMDVRGSAGAGYRVESVTFIAD